MGLSKDYTGQKIGRLTFLSSFHRGKKKMWKIKCDCGCEIEHRSDYISIMKCLGRKFECKNCYLVRKCPVVPNKKYGRWTVIEKTYDKVGHLAWVCKCECGTERILRTTALSKKKTLSCGCLARKLSSKYCNDTQYPPSHGMKKNNSSKEKDSIYRTRRSVLIKCYNNKHASYKSFGDQGYTVCDVWKNGAKDFYEWALSQKYEIGDAVYIKDGFKEFNPENCFLLKRSEFFSQYNARFITFKHETKNLTDWAKKLGCSIACLCERLKKYEGYGIDKIMDLSWTPKKNQIYGTEKFEKNIVDLYQSGKSYEEICKQLGCTTSTVKRFLNKNGIQSRACKTRFSVKMDTLKDEFLKDLPNMTTKQMMEKYQIKNHASFHFYKRKWTL